MPRVTTLFELLVLLEVESFDFCISYVHIEISTKTYYSAELDTSLEIF